MAKYRITKVKGKWQLQSYCEGYYGKDNPKGIWNIAGGSNNFDNKKEAINKKKEYVRNDKNSKGFFITIK